MDVVGWQRHINNREAATAACARACHYYNPTTITNERGLYFPLCFLHVWRTLSYNGQPYTDWRWWWKELRWQSSKRRPSSNRALRALTASRTFKDLKTAINKAVSVVKSWATIICHRYDKKKKIRSRYSCEKSSSTLMRRTAVISSIVNQWDTNPRPLWGARSCSGAASRELAV